MFEWIIQSMKRYLKKLLGWSRVDYEQLHTLLTEIQTVINSRSITFLYISLQKKCSLQITCISKSICFNNEDLNIRSQHLHNLLEHFRNKWRTEYLTELRENLNCKVKDHECKIKEGHVVIIHDDKKSRASWSVAKVEKVLLSKDNKVRDATIKYVINGKTVVINRSVNETNETNYCRHSTIVC